jgi:hypothetical protein
VSATGPPRRVSGGFAARFCETRRGREEEESGRRVSNPRPSAWEAVPTKTTLDDNSHESAAKTTLFAGAERAGRVFMGGWFRGVWVAGGAVHSFAAQVTTIRATAARSLRHPCRRRRERRFQRSGACSAATNWLAMVARRPSPACLLVANLIWRVFCQAPLSVDVLLGVSGALAGRHERKVQSGRLRGQTDIRGLRPQDPVFVAARCLRTGAAGWVGCPRFAREPRATVVGLPGCSCSPRQRPGRDDRGTVSQGRRPPRETRRVRGRRRSRPRRRACAALRAGAASVGRGGVGRARRSR